MKLINLKNLKQTNNLVILVKQLLPDVHTNKLIAGKRLIRKSGTLFLICPLNSKKTLLLLKTQIFKFSQSLKGLLKYKSSPASAFEQFTFFLISYFYLLFYQFLSILNDSVRSIRLNF
jgi:hypothetical protein